MKKYTFNEILSYVGSTYEIAGHEENNWFDKVMPLPEGDENSLCWLSPNAKNKEEQVNASKAKIILCSLDEQTDHFSSKLFIKVENPRLIFSRIVKALFADRIEYGIHPTAVIHPDAIISEDVYIGPHCIIGRCHIGRHAVLHGHVVVSDKVKIGMHVTIQANTTIGGVGFGYEKNDQNEFELFPHTGGVVIEDHVDIGANTCIDGGLSDRQE